MGGRGASSGISNKGKVYGTEYSTILKSGNIKFVKKNRKDAEELIETITKGRIYVTLNSKGEPSQIYYFNNELKRNRRVDITQWHQKIKPHTHNYEEKINKNGKKGVSKLTTEEKKMVDRVKKLWYNYKR